MKTTFVNLENRSNDFYKILVLYIFQAREDDLNRSQPCKKSGRLSVCHSVLEHKSRISQESLKRFSQNLVICVFQAREDDLDKSQHFKKSGCLSVCPWT